MENAVMEAGEGERAERAAGFSQPARVKRKAGFRGWIAPICLLGGLIIVGVGLAAWKENATQQANAAAASQPEPVETIMVATAQSRSHRRATTSIGTVVATRSITLRN